MKKTLTTILAALLVLTFVNCASTNYGVISKVEKDTYSVEVSEFSWFWWIVPQVVPFSTKSYIALCKAEANGGLVCEKGAAAMLGFGDVK
ncbi:hypothetical protein [Leptospira sp. GIMC2001]|uniref:hypothetical protein n=1 Tax=Leptospira sp. GIMC2001 TaxID=1513297 RepID=UPI00234BF1CF|nr:hypothetical protein [Leptospira sp. GIMC2001]WCL50004.1 hypothetical protein O4O04_04075 [Leptospira sp. GIMC2001]